jgi:hypothetical protein
LHVAISVPDAIGPVVGWRAWLVDAATLKVGQPPTVCLNSVAFNCRWPARSALSASCHDPVKRCARPPANNCRCGIYAVHAPKQVFQSVRFRGPLIVGQVSLWGRVVVGKRGWRAQYAYPKRLFVVAQGGRDLDWVISGLEAYGVPLCLMSWREIRNQAPTVTHPPRLWRRLMESLSV